MWVRIPPPHSFKGENIEIHNITIPLDQKDLDLRVTALKAYKPRNPIEALRLRRLLRIDEFTADENMLRGLAQTLSEDYEIRDKSDTGDRLKPPA